MYYRDNSENKDFGTSFRRQLKRGSGIGGDPNDWSPGDGGPDGGPTSGGGDPVGWSPGDGGPGGPGGGGPVGDNDGPHPIDPVGPGGGPGGGGTGGGTGGGGGPVGDEDGGPFNPMPIPPHQLFTGTGSGGHFNSGSTANSAPAWGGFRPNGDWQDPVSGATYSPNHPNNPNSQAYKFRHPQAAAPAPAPFFGGNRDEKGGGNNFGVPPGTGGFDPVGPGGGLGGGSNSQGGEDKPWTTFPPAGGASVVGGGGWQGQGNWNGNGIGNNPIEPKRWKGNPVNPSFGGGGPMPLPPRYGDFNLNQHPKLQGMVDTFRQDHPRPEGGWNWGDINNLKRRRF